MQILLLFSLSLFFFSLSLCCCSAVTTSHGKGNKLRQIICARVRTSFIDQHLFTYRLAALFPAAGRTNGRTDGRRGPPLTTTTKTCLPFPHPPPPCKKFFLNRKWRHRLLKNRKWRHWLLENRQKNSYHFMDPRAHPYPYYVPSSLALSMNQQILWPTGWPPLPAHCWAHHNTKLFFSFFEKKTKTKKII